MNIPDRILSGYHPGGHVQGIAVDQTKGHIYFSFTTMLLKTDFEGNPIGSVRNLAGHLGCITFCQDDGKLYGSLEYKHDIIGRGIINRTGQHFSDEDAFYLVQFDTDKITEMDMDAESSGVMKGIYLRDVLDDYNSVDEVSGKLHRYGCSGIDGTAYGPVFGADKNSSHKLMVSYGVYGDTGRDDNDHQVILQYDISDFDKFARAINQTELHHSGPEKCERRYFLYTGNTTYGIQNLEYDPYTGNYFAAVYVGKKDNFPNPPMFIINGSIPAAEQMLIGRAGERGNVLTLKGSSEFPYGQTGMAALGGGYFAMSIPSEKPEEHLYHSTVVRYRFDPEAHKFYTEKIVD